MIVASPIWDHGRVQKDPRLAFAIMPFRPKWSSYVYNDFIKPAALAAGLIPQRADEMTERAYPDYRGGPERARRLRELLRDAMEREGFMVYEYEWWHFDYKDWRRYRVLDVAFSAIR